MKKSRNTAAVVALCCAALSVLALGVHLLVQYPHYLRHPEYSAPFWVYALGGIVTCGAVALAGVVLFAVLWRKK
ncbi:MAG: hypothetical protein PHO66_03945 [Eubacteriales bacterium]|nr:hypothetical protein [Eubacteriales bacterium]